MASADGFTAHMPDVATLLLGKPNLALSTKDEWRFGSNGSVSVDLAKGTFFDHSTSEGGGVLGLIERCTGMGGRDAVGWMTEHGLQVDALPARQPDDAAAQAAMLAARRRGPKATYDYLDESGHLLFQACRFEWEHAGARHKTFSQRRRAREGDEPEKIRDGWVWSIKGERMVPYRLPELIADRDAGWPLFLVEGEKDVDTLRAIGLAATCNPMGAGKWWDALTPHFLDATIVILPDNDEPGQKHAAAVAAKLHAVAARVSILDLPGQPLKGDVTDWVAAGGSRSELLSLVEQSALDWKPSPAARETRFNRISFGELRERKAKAPDFIVDDWMVAKEVSFFAGESEAGKTFLAIDIALRIALGWPVFGRRTKPGLVIYQIGESGDSLLDLRIPAWIAHFGAGLPGNVPFEVLPSKINLWNDDVRAKDGTEELLSTIAGIRADYPGLPLAAFFVDTYSKASLGSDEISGKDTGRIIANAERIARTTGAHVPIIHHFPKGGTSLRGHGSLKADVNSVAMVSSDPNTKIRTIRFDKLKDGEKGTMQFELKQVRLGEREDGKPITSCVVLPVGEKERLRAQVVSGAVGVKAGQNAFLRAFFAAIDKHGILPPPGFECPSNAKLIDYEIVRAVYFEMNPPHDIDANLDDEQREAFRMKHKDATRKALKRGAEDLAQKMVLGFRAVPNEAGGETYFAWWKGRPVYGFARTYPPEPKQVQPMSPDMEAELNEVQF